MGMKNKICGYFTVILMVCCVWGLNMKVQAESYGDFTYEALEDGTIGITSYKGEEENLEIPSEIDGKTVTMLVGGASFFSNTDLKSIRIPQSIKKITVAFGFCENLTAIHVQEGNSTYSSIDGVLFDKEKKCLMVYPVAREETSYVIPTGVQSIYDDAFSGCKNLQEVRMPEGVLQVGTWAFLGCENLKNITFPETIESIGMNAFGGTLWMQEQGENVIVNGILLRYNNSTPELIIPEVINGQKVTGIGGGAFERSDIKSVKMPNTIKSIGQQAFCWCTSLEKVELSNSLEIIETAAFCECNALKEISLPKTLRRIGVAAFECCHSLKRVEIPENVQELERNAFSFCKELEEISVDPKNPYFTSVNGVLFDKQQTLLMQYPAKKAGDSYAIPSSVTAIDHSAFDGSLIKEITIPEYVTKIGLGAFYGCEDLKKIVVQNRQCIIGEDIANLALQPVTLGLDTVIYGYTGSTAQVYAKKHNKKFVAVDEQPKQDEPKQDDPKPLPKEGAKLTDAKTKAVYRVTKEGKTLEYAGATNKKVSAVTIPGKLAIGGVTYQVTSIGKSAFQNHKTLKKVTIPEGVTKIGSKAFYQCKKLKTITIKTKKLTAKTVGAKAFKGIHSKAVIKAPKAKKKAYKNLLKAKGAGKRVKVK